MLTSGANKPLWNPSDGTSGHVPLDRDQTVDVCIVGAGIAGLSCAYLLSREKKSVIVLDDGRIGGGQTERTTAHLANAIDDRYFEIERLHGERGAQLAAQSHTAAIDRIQEISTEEAMACDFARVNGYLFLGPGQEQSLLERELAAVHRAGLTAVLKVSRAPIDFFETGPCLCFPRQGQFHPLKYLAGLARAIERDGGAIYTGSHVENVEGGESPRVHIRNGPAVTARAVIVATNTPINDWVTIHTKQAPYLTYAIGASIPRGSVPAALFWDMEDPYHYVRTQPGLGADEDFLIIGGEDHKTGQARDAHERFVRLETWGRERFPMIGEVRFRWSGQVMEPVDGVAFIGPNPGDENVFIATGDSGMGMTHGTIAGILLTDLIMGRENPWAELYNPSRKTLKAAGEFVSENLNVARQYGDWLTSGDVASATDIRPGQGAVIRRGLHKLAVYRDQDGEMHECSATCPHLGCVVQWNDAEKTWDCPCHGSRFDALGSVISGPANVDLRPVEAKVTAAQRGR